MNEIEQCPFLDSDDPRCGHILRLERLDEAFRLCLGDSDQCAIHRIMERSRKARLLAFHPAIPRAKSA